MQRNIFWINFFYTFVAQLVGAIAQLVEQWTENPCVPGSNPGSTTFSKNPYKRLQGFFCAFFKAKMPLILNEKNFISLSLITIKSKVIINFAFKSKLRN